MLGVLQHYTKRNIMHSTITTLYIGLPSFQSYVLLNKSIYIQCFSFPQVLRGPISLPKLLIKNIYQYQYLLISGNGHIIYTT